MRSLAKPEVVETALVAGFVSALACFPRLYSAPKLSYPVWYLEAMLFLGSIVLWAFVFAWHTEYSGRPVVTWNIPRPAFAWATATGLAAALLLRFFFDPMVRARSPEDYPVSIEQWGAMTLFSLTFTQLFLVFAPLAWLLRLTHRQTPAAILTVLFGLYVLVVKNYRSPHPPTIELWLALVLVRIVVGVGSIFFFLQGGVVLVSWWAFLVQSRHLFAFFDR